MKFHGSIPYATIVSIATIVTAFVLTFNFLGYVPDLSISSPIQTSLPLGSGAARGSDSENLWQFVKVGSDGKVIVPKITWCS